MQTIREEGESSCAINRSEINVGDDRPNKGGNHFDEEKLLEKEDNTIMQIISQEGESSRGMDANHSNVARGGPPKGDTRLSEETVANEIGHVNEEGQMVPIFYVATVPEPKYYDQPLHMSMESLMIQEDYKEAIKAKVAEGHERAIQPKVAAKESAVNQVDYNEDIGVLCPDKERTDYFFETPRSILARSPVLERIFASSDFVQGSETFFYFHEDTATCFLAVKFYLEQGPDRFTANKLEIFATTKEISATTKETIKLSNTATIEILLGLHNLASKLELEGLVRITTTVLNALEWKVDAACCMNLAGLVFGQGFFKPAIEDFVLKHVGKNFNELSDAKIWHYIVKELSESKLGVEWAKLEAANKSPRLIVREGKGKERAPAILAMQATHSPIPPAISRDTVHNAFTVGNAAENVATTNTSRPHSIDKARSLLGGLPTDARTGTSRLTDSAEEYASRTPFDNTYKARKVMGMNSDGGGKIAGRRKLSLAQKARIRAARAAERGLKKMMG